MSRGSCKSTLRSVLVTYVSPSPPPRPPPCGGGHGELSHLFGILRDSVVSPLDLCPHLNHPSALPLPWPQTPGPLLPTSVSCLVCWLRKAWSCPRTLPWASGSLWSRAGASSARGHLDPCTHCGQPLAVGAFPLTGGGILYTAFPPCFLFYYVPLAPS